MRRILIIILAVAFVAGLSVTGKTQENAAGGSPPIGGGTTTTFTYTPDNLE